MLNEKARENESIDDYDSDYVTFGNQTIIEGSRMGKGKWETKCVFFFFFLLFFPSPYSPKKQLPPSKTAQGEQLEHQCPDRKEVVDGQARSPEPVFVTH